MLVSYACVCVRVFLMDSFYTHTHTGPPHMCAVARIQGTHGAHNTQYERKGGCDDDDDDSEQ